MHRWRPQLPPTLTATEGYVDVPYRAPRTGIVEFPGEILRNIAGNDPLDSVLRNGNFEGVSLKIIKLALRGE